MEASPFWSARGRYLAGLGVLALFGWQAFVRGVRVPLLGWIDLAIHEAGHVLTYALPDLATAAMGSGLQILVPLGLAAVFWWGRDHDDLGTAICLGWAGTSMQDASVYIADAPFQRLQLIGGHHDWAWVLGPRGLDHLEWAQGLSSTVWALGLVAWFGGVAVCAWALASERADPDCPAAAPDRPAGVVGAAARGRPVGPDDPPAAGPGGPGVVDTGGTGDPPRARAIW